MLYLTSVCFTATLAAAGARAGERDPLLETVDKDRMNLELLLSALLDADSDNRTHEQKRKAVLAADQRHHRPATQSRSNYTFSNDKARIIDLENQRLLKVS